MSHPKKIETVHVENLDGELCIYDWQRMEVHNLNPTAAAVWQQCDGETTPQQMAAQLNGDLTPAQAEELVWLTLKRLEKAKLLENKVVKIAGRKVYTRREMLTKLGVTALMLPVITSIVAPGPVEAQSEPNNGGGGGPAPVTQIVMYSAGTSNGNLGGRAGADALCQGAPNRPAGYANARAFISVDAGDEIRDMPGNYAVPTTLPIVGPTGTAIADNWAHLLSSDTTPLHNSFETAGVASDPGNAWWSGCGAQDGSLGANICLGWSNGGGGTRGVCGALTAVDENITGIGPISLGGATTTCDNAMPVLCIAY